MLVSYFSFKFYFVGHNFTVHLIYFLILSPPNGVVFTKTMLHYFDSKQGSSIFQDIITGIAGYGLKRSDFIGYNVVDLVTSKDLIREENGYCNKTF